MCCHGLCFLPVEQSSLQMLQYFFHLNSVRNVWCCIHLSWWITLSWLQTPSWRQTYSDAVVVHIPSFPSACFILRVGVGPRGNRQYGIAWVYAQLRGAAHCSLNYRINQMNGFFLHGGFGFFWFLLWYWKAEMLFCVLLSELNLKCSLFSLL